MTSHLDPFGLPDDAHTLPTITELSFAAPGVRSLCWDGDELVDWIGGGQRWTLDGHALPPVREPEDTFDDAVVLPNSPWAAVFERRGERGLILRDGQPWRTLKRAEHVSGCFGYPIVLFRLADGRAVIAHCPEDYCCLQIDDLETGETLAACPREHAEDYFPAGLEVSPCGRWLLSGAGWVWHPVSCIRAYDIEAALRDPRTLGGVGVEFDGWGDFADACFLPDSRVLMAVTGTCLDAAERASGTRFDHELAVIDLDHPEARPCRDIGDWNGGVMAMGNHHTLTFHDHLRLVQIDGVREVRSWPHVRFGGGVLALDSHRGRLAQARDGRITVLQVQAV